MILAEDVLLLLIDDASGKAVVDKTHLDLALAGGVLLDLATLGRGILRPQEGRVLGIFPIHTWPAVDSSHERGVRAGLHDVLVVGRGCGRAVRPPRRASGHGRG